MGDKVVLIDGHSILSRAFYGIPELTNSEGIHTNAVYGFLNIMFKIMEEETPSYLLVAFDVKAPTFRHELFSDYKGTRKPMPAELHEQVPIIKEVLKAMGIKTIEGPGYEADDIIGTLAKTGEEKGYKIAIISGDRDLLQLATDKTMVRIPKTKWGGTEVEDYYAGDVLEKYKVTPSEFIDLKALMGDSSDNIPGVAGIGEKTATKMIVEYKSIENIYQNIEKITPNRAKEALKNNEEMAKLSKVLATIDTNAVVDCPIEEGKLGDIYTKEAYLLFKKLEFKSILSKFEGNITAQNDAEKYFTLIDSLEKAEGIFKKALQQSLVGYHGFYSGNTLYGITITLSEEEIYYIPIHDKSFEQFILEQVKDLFFSQVKIAMIDLKEQLPYLSIDYRENVLDLEIAAYLLNPLKDTYHYDDLARDYLKLTVPSKQDLLGKSELKYSFSEKENEFFTFACYISYICFLAFNPLMELLEEGGMLKLYHAIEMPLIYVLYDMERIGIRIEKDSLISYGNELAVKINEIEKEIHQEVGEVFNINSPKQLGEILFNKLKLPGAKKTKTGYSTSADILEKLAPEYPVISKILEYRQFTKLKSTYAEGLVNYIGEDNRIHGKFNQSITATGRISSTEPNLQNIPIKMELGRAIRKVFVPEEGYVFVDADYSQIELRVLASISGDENLINAYKEAKDIHRITASKVFHTPLSEVTSRQRSNAKAVNFGIVYGISSFGLSQDLSISRKEASEYINQYFLTYPVIKSFLDHSVGEAKEKGYAITMFGRRRPIPELKSSNFMQRSFGERIAMNSPIQGTAADIMKIAMINVYNELKKNNLKSRLVLQVHDELLIEAAKEEVEQVREILTVQMKNAADLKVPLEIGIGEGHNWYESH